MPTVHTIKQGDTLPVMNMTLYRDEALTQPVDLTNADVVTVKAGNAGSEPLLDTAMEIVTPADGTIRYKFLLTDWANIEPGSYDMEVEVVWTNGDVSTYPKVGFATLEVEADLDQTVA